MKHGKQNPLEYSDFGLEPTYKELKLMDTISVLSTILGLEPTYKELKPFFLSLIFKLLIRLEPTYKELKHGKVIKEMDYPI
ncbi:MAG: hypothetical protein CH6_1077 [Candidatus Kapaibacterium sp.]|nr:MAG: hypothetical protein CH6_1077 [Candidatus Kapabacteria bacterium]